MSDITDAVTDRVITNSSMDGDATRAERRRFAPNDTPLARVRILRCRLYADEGGVATATFAGKLEQQALWLEAGGSGRLSVYAEVARAPWAGSRCRRRCGSRSCQRASRCWRTPAGSGRHGGSTPNCWARRSAHRRSKWS